VRIAGALLLIAVVAWIYIGKALTVYPTPETESAFLKTYSPNSTIEQFKDAWVASMSSGRVAAAGSGFATHEEDFEPVVVIRNADWVALIQTLRNDVALQLAVQNAEILEESGAIDSGFRIRYALGKSEGTVTLGPLQILHGSQLGTGRIPYKTAVRVRIRIQEKWIKGKSNQGAIDLQTQRPKDVFGSHLERIGIPC
jgi:hypothetical protein